MCISITISHRGSGGSAIISFSATDGSRTLTGDQAWGWGGMGTPTDEEYKISVTPYILGWFGATEVDLCGYVLPILPGSSNTIIIIIAAAVLYYFSIMRGK